MFAVCKHNGVLEFRDFGGYESRNPSTMWCMQQADKKYNWGDFGPIVIKTSDYENRDDDFTYSKQRSFSRLVPDFNFHGWPQCGYDDYEKAIEEISEAGSKPAEVMKVGWIGARTHPNRSVMLDIGAKNPDLFDFFDMNWIHGSELRLNSTRYISMKDLASKYAALIDIEGNGYSGRLKYMMWSRRPILLVDRPHKEYFYEHMKEWEHYIPVNRDMSDLIEKTKWIFDNYEKALEIAERAREFSLQHLTRDACYAQWNRIITA